MILAMWSGPRNLSTTMMYSFGARKDFSIWDEPYYAAYLNMTGLEHPMRKEILAQGILNPEEVRSACVGKIPNGKSNYFQKHQTQHMLPSFDREWIKDVTNVFLIRHPARVISSYEKKRENPTLEDLGFKQQYEIFDYVCQKTGKKPPVVDSYLVRKNPVSFWYFKNEELLAVDAMNDPRSYMVGKRLIEMGISPDLKAVGDKNFNLKLLLKP